MATLIVAGLVSLAWCAFAIWLGPRIGYVDRPDDPTLKAHERPAVPLGGVGIFLGVNLAASIRGELELGLLIASTMVLILGLIDDRRGVDPKVRLVVEILAAVVLILNVAGNPGVVFLLLGMALVVFAINSVNLFDGLDGLVGSVALVTAVGLAVLAQGRGLSQAFYESTHLRHTASVRSVLSLLGLQAAVGILRASGAPTPSAGGR